PLDVVVETRPLRHLRRHVVVAAAYREDVFHHVERASHRAHIGIGTEVTGAVVLHASRYEYSRKRLLNRDFDVGIRLVIAQRDVEARMVFLDEICFEYQRVSFARHHDGFEIADETDQMSCLHAIELIVGEVATHARAQSLRLSYIEGSPVPSLPQIDAGSFGKVR